MKLLLTLLLSLPILAYAHGWNDPHQSYKVYPEAKTIYIQASINNYRNDIDSFYIVVREGDDTIEFASNQRTYTQVNGSRPLPIGVYVKNDKPLPRTLRVCSISYGKSIDSITKKPSVLQMRSEVCTLVILRPVVGIN